MDRLIDLPIYRLVAFLASFLEVAEEPFPGLTRNIIAPSRRGTDFFLADMTKRPDFIGYVGDFHVGRATDI